MLQFNIGELTWQSIIQQKLTVQIEGYPAVFVNGVPHTVIAQPYTVTQLALN
jgi:hypothetical protein